MSGSVSAYKSIKVNNDYEDGEAVFQLKQFQRGDIIGEDLLLGHCKRQYSSMALSDIDCYVINRKDALNYFHGEESDVKNISKELYRSADELERARNKERVYEGLKKCVFGKRYTNRIKTNKLKYKENVIYHQLHSVRKK